MNRLPKATKLAHHFIGDHLSQGDVAIDATAGNGHDTLFLAEKVGPTGKVHAFDIQAKAIEATRERVAAHPQVCLHLLGHEAMTEVVREPVQTIMFNLGYLPSADKSVITQPGTTKAAIQHATELIASGGIITIAVYTGHEGGAEESDEVDALTSALPQSEFTVAQYRFTNQRNSPPHLVVIGKR